MSDWKERFNDFFLSVIQAKYGYVDAEEVSNVRQETRNFGYCETCWDEYEVIQFDYRVVDDWESGELYTSFAYMFEGMS